MVDQIVVVAQPREKQGTSAARGLRREGILPGVVYGEGKAAENVELNEHDFEQILAHHASEHLVMDLQIGKAKAKKVLLKEIQHHPVSGRIIHADFREISMTKKLRLQLPIELDGEPSGVVQQGGVLEHLLREIEVECLPGDLTEGVAVDVSQLNIGDRLTVADINLPKDKFTILTPLDYAIAAVSAPRVQEEVVAEEEEGVLAEGAEEGAEPEVIGEKKEEGEGAEEPAKS